MHITVEILGDVKCITNQKPIQMWKGAKGQFSSAFISRIEGPNSVTVVSKYVDKKW